MKSPWYENQQRVTDLLAERAVFGLTAAEESELEELLENVPQFDRESFDYLAAECELAMGVAAGDPLPAGLQQRIRADAAFELGREPHEMGKDLA